MHKGEVTILRPEKRLAEAASNSGEGKVRNERDRAVECLETDFVQHHTGYVEGNIFLGCCAKVAVSMLLFRRGGHDLLAHRRNNFSRSFWATRIS